MFKLLAKLLRRPAPPAVYDHPPAPKRSDYGWPDYKGGMRLPFYPGAPLPQWPYEPPGHGTMP